MNDSTDEVNYSGVNSKIKRPVYIVGGEKPREKVKLACKIRKVVQSNFNDSNTYGTMKISSRLG